MNVKTFFAPVERASEADLRQAVELAADNPILVEILRDVGGLISVVDSHRQLIAVNDTLLETMGLADGASLLGLRPGEALGCRHAADAPGGCGTGVGCRTCGAAIAMLASQATGHPVDGECTLAVQRDGKPVDLEFKVRASPISIDGRKFILLFLQDVSEENRRRALERTFFHDLANAVMGVSALAQLLTDDDHGQHPELTRSLNDAVATLVDEVRVQRLLLGKKPDPQSLRKSTFAVGPLVDDLVRLLRAHPAARNRRIDVQVDCRETLLQSDKALLGRVVRNMLVNACEATETNGSIRLFVNADARQATIGVWNSGVIAEEIVPRIFQRHFTTKGGSGRGLGAYGMKLIGESYLGGKVAFTTSAAAGTLFTIKVPLGNPTPPRHE